MTIKPAHDGCLLCHKVSFFSPSCLSSINFLLLLFLFQLSKLNRSFGGNCKEFELNLPTVFQVLIFSFCMSIYIHCRMSISVYQIVIMGSLSPAHRVIRFLLELIACWTFIRLPPRGRVGGKRQKVLTWLTFFMLAKVETKSPSLPQHAPSPSSLDSNPGEMVAGESVLLSWLACLHVWI